MKKYILSAAAIVALTFSANAVITNTSNATVISIVEEERTKVELAALPEPVKTTLASDEYKGWAATEAYWVTKTEGVADHYEISLKNEAGVITTALLDANGKKVEKKAEDKKAEENKPEEKK